MAKRVIAGLVACMLLMGILPFSAYAVNEAGPTEVQLFDDGIYIEIYTATNPARVSNTVSGYKEYVCRDSNGTLLWKAKLTATFAYSGGWYTCTTASCNVTISDSQWYVISNNTVRSSNNAFTYLTMGIKYLGVTVEKPQYTIRLTCDINGNLS